VLKDKNHSGVMSALSFSIQWSVISGDFEEKSILLLVKYHSSSLFDHAAWVLTDCMMRVESLEICMPSSKWTNLSFISGIVKGWDSPPAFLTLPGLDGLIFLGDGFFGSWLRIL
jgi:hypothetical protein